MERIREFFHEKLISYQTIAQMFLVLLPAIAYGAISYVALDKINHQENIQENHENKITEIKRDIDTIKISIANIDKDTHRSEEIQYPAHCTCVAKEDSRKPHISICPAKNDTCDEESSKFAKASKTVMSVDES